MNKIRIVIADDNEEIRSYFNTVLNREKDMEVVGLAPDGEDACRLAAQTSPDIILMDIQMKAKADGIEAISRIKKETPEVKVIVLTIHEDDEYLFQAYAAGAMDYIVKTNSLVDILNSIRDAYNNKLFLRPDIAGKIIAEFTRLKNEHNTLIHALNIVSRLTNSELDILRAIYAGNSYRQLSKARFVEEVTIRTQVNKILKKFEMKKMKDVVKLLRELKIFDTYDFLK